MTPHRTTLSVVKAFAPVHSPLELDPGSLSRFLDHCHRRKHPTRSNIVRPGEPANPI